MQGLLIASLLLVLASPLAARENVMLVLDASGSMWGQIDERSKVEIARDAVDELLTQWKPENHLGLVAYGHNRRGDCEDIEVLQPAGPLDADAFRARVRSLNPRGMTPLSAAVIRAAETLRSSEQKATVILISDGEETCNLDPCEVGARLQAEGVDFTAHVIGFDVSDPLHQDQLRCLADSTGGRYFNASDAVELGRSLTTLAQVATEAPPPPASASLRAAEQVTAANNLEVNYAGPADRGDYIAIADAEGRERSYVYVEPGQGEGTVVLRAPADAGVHTLRYVSSIRRDESLLASQALQVVEASARIEAPDSVVQGGTVEIRTQGPVDGRQNWVGIAPTDAPVTQHLSYAYIQSEQFEVALQAPSEAGGYEIRYVLSGAAEALVRRPLRVISAETRISGPQSATVASSVEVQAIGPKGNGHWIAFAETGDSDGANVSYAYVQEGIDNYTLKTPDTPGDYELRYVLVSPLRVAARQAVRIEAATVRFEAPASVAAGERFEFSVDGPDHDMNWITIVAAGSADDAYLDYVYLRSGPSFSLTAPDSPGAHELRLILSDGTVAGRQSIEVR